MPSHSSATVIIKQKSSGKSLFFVSLKATGEKSRIRSWIRNPVVRIRRSGSVSKSHGSGILLVSVPNVYLSPDLALYELCFKPERSLHVLKRAVFCIFRLGSPVSWPNRPPHSHQVGSNYIDLMIYGYC
jgi:hypothetical protein